MRINSFNVLISFVVLISCTDAHCQKQANNWHFGEGAALSFSQNRLQPLSKSSISSVGASTSISDPVTGELLFYSNGTTVWNKNHEVMLNGNGLYGSIRSTNTSYAVPVPGSTNRYFLFTITTNSFVHEDNPQKATVYYSIIDMALDNGNGGIVSSQKNTLLVDSVTEKIAAIPHSNGRDFWLLLHEINNNIFQVYLITENGITLSQKISVGQDHMYHLLELKGHMKASPDNSLIACLYRYWNIETGLYESAPSELFEFDNTSGIISNPISVGEYSLSYGVSFSTDSRKLYIHGFSGTGPDAGDHLYQLDLNNEDPLSTRKGLIRLNPFIRYNHALANISLQLGPDGRIYGTGNINNMNDPIHNSLIVINSPNAKGLDSNVEIKSIPWPDNRISIDLPNYIQSYFRDITPYNNPNIPCSSNEIIELTPNPAVEAIVITIPERCFQPFLLKIYNSVGQEIAVHYIKSQVSPGIPVSHLASGMYFVQFYLKGQRYIKRFIIREY